MRLVEGRSSAERSLEMERHLPGCSTCAAWVEEARRDEAVIPDLRRALAASMGEQEQALAGADELAPTGLSHYRVVRRIGAGGMGVVWEAEQDNPRRRVALKVLRGGLTSPQTRARFEIEAQILGRLEHDGIARIYEAGTFRLAGEERSYFAMEFIEGRLLDEWCSDAERTTQEKLDLFLEICDAVSHAHRRGVIHRDLKPANVLVSPRGRAKVLDFGVARAANDDGSAAETLTLEGQILGTLPYMSPEQLGGNALDIDTRSDVYSLGVVLFEMFAGRRPIDVAGLPLAEAVRRLSADDAPGLGEVTRSVERDLETIAATAMAKERSRRYPSVEALAADIQRMLKHEPISARPPSATYFALRFVQRNRAVVGAAVAVAVALTLGIITTSRQADRASAAEQVSAQRADALEAESARLESTVTFLTDLLGTNNPAAMSRGVSYTVREALDRSAEKLDAGDIEDPLVEAALSSVVGNVYNALGIEDRAREYLKRALELRREHEPDTSLLAQVLNDYGAVLANHFDDRELAIELFQEAEALYRSIDDPDDRKRLGTTLSNLAGVALGQRKFVRARTLAVEALALHRASLGDRHHAVANDTRLLAIIADRTDDPEAAEEYFLEALAIHEAADDPRSIYTSYTQAHFARLLWKIGLLDEAEELYLESRALRVETVGEDSSWTKEIDRALELLDADR